MTFRKYEHFNFRDSTLKTIDRVNAVIEEYDGAMSVRQIHYQFVAHNWYDNTQANYDALGDVISKARLAGLISWTAIEDRNRYLQGVRFWKHPQEALQEARNAYKTDPWADQPWRPFVLSEKASSEGTVSQVCMELRVDFLSVRGYNSQTMAWELGQRCAEYIRKGQRPIGFHVGDLDPSGWHMTEDNRRRISMFAGTDIIVQRLALNMNQVEQYNPPPNFAKQKDARTPEYIKTFGTDKCYEIDSLAPPVLAGFIRDAVLKIRDESKWEESLAQEVNDIRYIDDLLGSPDPN